ncbi:hypothetical protein [Desulfosoma caldarium]|uniref:Uncharacterized protein n=1 Tax=Desulfosoma caldarium TaxID=610254 RepID=A0A3N1UHY5_9BACT|nr:hypothetical protein [Desulfosoma caldarium]ROQ90874.1 hypothetical protein EDC27_2130 [Desulfosoma caldarium]
MEDDLITCLTRQVKEEVLENYLTQRRLIELETEDVETQAKAVRALAQNVGKRFTRLGYLTMDPEMLKTLIAILDIPQDSYWRECLEKPFARGVRFIKVTALTHKGKFRKLLLESYNRLLAWMAKYKDAFKDLELEVRALNANIQAFQSNFDLLTILNFLKSLDVCGLEQKHFLGSNFTAEEIMSIEKKLYIHPHKFERFQLPPPLDLPAPALVQDALGKLADEVFRKHHNQIKRLMR